MSDPRWLDADTAAGYIGERVDRLPKLVKSGRLPPPSYHLGPRKPRYDRLQIDAMFAGGPTSVPDNLKEAARATLRARLQGRAAQASRRHDQGIPLREEGRAANAGRAG